MDQNLLDQHRHEQACAEYAQRLQSLDVLATGVTKELTGILKGITGNLYFAMEALPAGSATLENLEEIGNLCKQAAEMCRQLSTYCGRGKPVLQSLRLSTFIEDMVNLIQVNTCGKASVRFNLSETPAVTADPVLIRQAVLSLVSNAVDAIDKPSGVIVLSTDTTSSERVVYGDFMSEPLLAGVYATLAVQDTGRGIPPDNVPRIFDPFFSTKYRGRGLGLATVLGIIRSHQGAISVKSEPGRGSIFTMYFPAEAEQI